MVIHETSNVKKKKRFHKSTFPFYTQRSVNKWYCTDNMFSVSRQMCKLLLTALWLCCAELACCLFYCLGCCRAKSCVCISELTSGKISSARYLLLQSHSRFYALIWGVTGRAVCMHTKKMFTFLRTEKVV